MLMPYLVKCFEECVVGFQQLCNDLMKRFCNKFVKMIRIDLS